MSEVSITVTVDTVWAAAILACADLLDDDPSIMDGHHLRTLAERLWDATIIAGSASPEGAAHDARPDIMPGIFDVDCDALEWRLAAHYFAKAAASIDSHLDKLGIDPL